MANRLVPFPYYEYYTSDITSVSWDTFKPLEYSEPGWETFNGIRMNVRLTGDMSGFTVGFSYAEFGVGLGWIAPHNPTPDFNNIDWAFKLTAGYINYDVNADYFYPAEKMGPWINNALTQYYSSTHGYARGYGTTTFTGTTPPTAGIYRYPGVAGVGWYGINTYHEPLYFDVPYITGPIGYEQWFDDNPDKNPGAPSYTGYTNYGYLDVPQLDMTNNGVNGGIGLTANAGYFRQYVVGILDKDADIANVSVADIRFGTRLVGNGTTTTAQLVVNGVAVMTHNIADKVVYAEAYLDPTGWQPILGDYANGFIGPLGNNPQGWDTLELDYNTAGGVAASSPSTYMYMTYFPTYGDPNLPESIDVFNSKWGWYVDFVPTTPPEYSVGQLYVQSPFMCTNPGFGKTPAPPPFRPFWQSYVNAQDSGDDGSAQQNNSWSTGSLPGLYARFDFNNITPPPETMLNRTDLAGNLQTVMTDTVNGFTAALYTGEDTLGSGQYFNPWHIVAEVPGYAAGSKAWGDDPGSWAFADAILPGYPAKYGTGTTIVTQFKNGPWASAGYFEIDFFCWTPMYFAQLDYANPFSLVGLSAEVFMEFYNFDSPGLPISVIWSIRMIKHTALNKWHASPWGEDVATTINFVDDGLYHVYAAKTEVDGSNLRCVFFIDGVRVYEGAWVDMDTPPPGYSWAKWYYPGGTESAPPMVETLRDCLNGTLTNVATSEPVPFALEPATWSGYTDWYEVYDRTLTDAEIASITLR